MENEARICAAIVTFNRKLVLDSTIQAIAAQTQPVEVILVIDNASTDGTEQHCKALIDSATVPIEYRRLPKNVGSAGGFHECIRWAFDLGFEWVWLFDDDAHPYPDALKQLLSVRRKWEEENGNNATGLACNHVDADGIPFPSAHRSMDPVFLRERPASLSQFDQPFFLTQATIWAGLLLHKSAVDLAGMPLREYFLYYEDTEYTLRLTRAGGHIVVAPESRIHHESEADWVDKSAGMHILRSYYMLRNQIYTYSQTGRFQCVVLICSLALWARKTLSVLLHQPNKFSRLTIIARAFGDGIRGRLGMTLDPSKFLRRSSPPP